MALTILRNVGAYLLSVIASAFVSATAGGSGDATAVTGIAIDRLNPSTGSLAACARFGIAWSAVLAQDKTLSLGTVLIEQSDDGTNFDATAYETFTDPGVVATGGTGGSTERGITPFDVDLGNAKRWVRIKFTPDLSNTATDTASLLAFADLAGFDRLPA